MREMYHMLRLPGSDQPAVRFLWRESPSEEQSVYQFQSTLFGEVSAPSRANCTMRRNAEENGGDLLLESKPSKSIFIWTMAYRPATQEKKPYRNAETNDGITAPWRLLPTKAVNK